MASPTTWGFYGRSQEQAEIERILSSGRWFFCAISGRRRIGKTTLIQRALQSRPDAPALYFQVPDSDERGVVQTFRDALEDVRDSAEGRSLLSRPFFKPRSTGSVTAGAAACSCSDPFTPK